MLMEGYVILGPVVVSGSPVLQGQLKVCNKAANNQSLEIAAQATPQKSGESMAQHCFAMAGRQSICVQSERLPGKKLYFFRDCWLLLLAERS